jgi:hypothetical protein
LELIIRRDFVLRRQEFSTIGDRSHMGWPDIEETEGGGRTQWKRR